MPQDESTKAANLHDWIVSRIHLDFTVMADNLLGDGYVTQEERIALSNAIGQALDTFNASLNTSLPALRERHPWTEADPAPISSGYTGKSADAPAAGDTTKSIGHPIKALGGDRLGGYLVLWGTPEQKDLTGEYFTPETEELDAIYKAIGKLPTLYHHGMDSAVKTEVVGTIDILRADDVGLWAEAQLDMSKRYVEQIRRLVEEGKLFWSSGTFPGSRKCAPDGRIERWAICEGSLTPTPAEYRMLSRPISEIKSYYAEIGVDFDPPNEGNDRENVAAKLGLLDLLAMEAGLSFACK